MPLTREQLDAFHINGFVSCGKVLNDDELDPLRKEYDRLFAEARDSGHYRNLAIDDTPDKEKKRAAPTQMLQIMQVCERSLPFRRLLYDSRFLDMVQQILGPNLMLFHDQALFKPAHHGGAVFWHQDNAYWKCSPANLVSCWMTLDDVTIENGAMQLIPGSHLKPASHSAAKSTNTLLDLGDQVDASKAAILELPAGGCLLHHCQTYHYTAPNTTDRQRRAFIMHYMNPGTQSEHTKGEPFKVDFAHPVLRLRM